MSNDNSLSWQAGFMGRHPEKTAQEMYVLPCGTVTDNPRLAAELWSEAFYQAKDAIRAVKPAASQLLRGKPVRGLDKIMVKCDAVLELGEK